MVNLNKQYLSIYDIHNRIGLERILLDADECE